MVKKLIKYDFKSFAKIMVPIYLVLIGVAALYRFISVFETRSTFYDVFNGSAIFLLVLTLVFCFVLTFIVSVVRFYKGLYTAEGYLSHTLPVTPASHIFSKLTVSLIFDVFTVLVAVLTLAIATAGETFVEIMKAAFYLAKRFFRFIGAQGALYVIEALVALIVALAAAHLLMYMCISIGQLAKKHKVLAAVGVYFAIYVVKQMIGTLILAIGATSDLFVKIAGFVRAHPYGASHAIILGAMLTALIFGALYFFITHFIMKKHLNLE